MRVQVERDTLSSVGQAAHYVALGAVLGGNLFGRFAMHPAVREVSNPRERGKLVNAAWRRYGVVNSLSLITLAITYAPSRIGDRKAEDIAMAALVATGVASGIEGLRFARMEPEGAVPLTDGSEAAPEASDREARAKRTLNVLGAANLLSAIGVAAADAALAPTNHKHRLLKFR